MDNVIQPLNNWGLECTSLFTFQVKADYKKRILNFFTQYKCAVFEKLLQGIKGVVQYLQLLGSLLINFCICRRTDKAWCLLFPYHNTKKRTPGCKTAPSTAWMLNSDVERYKLYNHTCLKWFTMQQKSASLELWPKPLLDEPQSCREQPEIRRQIIAALYCTHTIDLFQINFHSCIFSA